MNRKHVLFLTLNVCSNRTPEENLGIYYLQKSLSQYGIDSDYIDCWLEEINHLETIKNLYLENYLFIGLSGCLSNIEEIRKIIPITKGRCPIICGGYGATFGYRELLEAGVLFAVLGEGDTTIRQVVDFFEGKIDISNIAGIAYKENNKIIVSNDSPIVNVNELPILDNRKYLDYIIKSKATVNILSSKGCLGNCIFCSISSFYRNSIVKWRGKSKENIIREIYCLYMQGARVFKFVDDSFLELDRDEKWVEDFSNALSAVSKEILFRISIRADTVDDKIIGDLKKAGLFAVSCGIESGSDQVLKRMAKKSNVKENQKALNIFLRHHIYVQAGFIMFDDQTTMNELWDNLLFLKKNMQIIIKGVFTEMYAAEGTPYAVKISKENKVVGRKFGNLLYKLENNKVKRVYIFLKKWHVILAEFYDKLIDPISAPKALQLGEYNLFYEFYLEIHKEDICFLEKVLACVTYDLEEEDLNKKIEDRKLKLIEDNKKVDQLYSRVGLSYTGSKNIFL